MRILHRAAISPVFAACLLGLPTAAQVRFDTIYDFTNGIPSSAPTLAHGVWYGASSGSTPETECGQVFQLNPPAAPGGSWTQTVLYSFPEPGGLGVKNANGCSPNYAPVMGGDGALYGLTSFGGEYGYGVFYELTPPPSQGGAWTENALYSFMIPPIAPLAPGPGGSFYEVADPGAFDTGFILWIQPPASPGAQWKFTTVCNFPADGPVSSIVFAPGGLFYGVGAGSSDEAGFVTEISADATGGTCAERVLYAFGGTGTYIEYPNTLIRAEDGTLYGTTVVGGAFELTPPASAGGTWTYTQLQTFGYYQPRTPLLLHDGKLYGTLDEYYEGKIPSGIIFELAPPAASGSEWTLTYLHQFTNGQVPEGVLVMDPAGGIWGATAAFGSTTEPYGTIYRIVP